MINHKHKCIFIHFPSTGGTSIESVFGGGREKFDCSAIPNFYLRQECKKAYIYDCGLFKHLSTELARELYSPYWDEYFKFSFIRNPWDWLASLWLKGPKRRRGENFSRWLRSPRLAPHEKQSPFNLCDQLTQMDFIGRFENLQPDFNTICDKIGIPQQQLPHKNKTKHKHYTEYYDDETREIVARKYARDIEYFGYEFSA